MINLLPPAIKEQVSFSKRNRTVQGYLWLEVFVIIGLAVLFGGAFWLVGTKMVAANKSVSDTDNQIAQYQELEAKVRLINGRLNAIKTIQDSQSHFSSVLSDLGDHTPQGVSISSITLTGDYTKPVQIAATANSYSSAVALRDSLVTSSRIANVDIQNVSNDSPGVFKISLVLSFKPGQAR